MKIIGHCAYCGSPVYEHSVWHMTAPLATVYTCQCNPCSVGTTTNGSVVTSGTPWR